jgi:hypothetical protein
MAIKARTLDCELAVLFDQVRVWMSNPITSSSATLFESRFHTGPSVHNEIDYKNAPGGSVN